ncbi:STAS domain-containing protein [Antarcticirhabdus aurantiaca]|uniref:STAS domain-containing protein n=1 Tax=Antarcticirhabdus aurantiaca TaxID=2606717 RepID=A0ACD4NT16_9HYPH|nr:STAS domain-containing protein [Antarcticirhabdus aurantiaca]WAJ29840.1 STAS domain-containing protein [Jeongeuplla avenae]
MPKRSSKPAPAEDVPALEAVAAPKAPPRRRRAKVEAPALEIEADAVSAEVEVVAEPVVDAAFAGLPPEIAAMLAAAAAAEAPADVEAEEEASGLVLPEGGEMVGLPAVLDLTAASELRETLIGHRGAPIVLDGSSVERLGGQCLQILLSARATWAADNRAFALATPSEALLRDLSILGVSPESLSTHESA